MSLRERILERFGSLRIRLTALNIVIFGLLQVIVWIVVTVAGSAIARERFRAGLIDRTDVIAGAIDAIEGDPLAGELTVELTDLLTSLPPRNTYFQLSDENGRIIWRSHSLRNYTLPPPLPDHARSREPLLQNLGTVDDFPVAVDNLEMATMRVSAAPNRNYIIQLASDRGIAEGGWITVSWTLLIFTGVSLLLSIFASWIMAGRYLAPLRSIAKQAGRISAEKLDQRVVVPDAADEIAELSKLMNRMLDRLERDFASQKQFIANVSHELRTPLTVLLGEARSRMNSENARTNGDFAAIVNEEARRMLGIVQGFLILADARSRDRLTVAMPVNIEEVVLSALTAVNAAAQERGVRVIPYLADTHTDVEPIVRGDHDLLQSMIENLLQNAIRFSPQGRPVLLRVTRDANAVVITVRDHGPGIPAELLDRVFELFFQVRPAANPSANNGIGLTIAKTVAEQHGGSISATNHDEGGCEFTIRLPLESRAATTPS